jgi:hypothetical protein
MHETPSTQRPAESTPRVYRICMRSLHLLGTFCSWRRLFFIARLHPCLRLYTANPHSLLPHQHNEPHLTASSSPHPLHPAFSTSLPTSLSATLFLLIPSLVRGVGDAATRGGAKGSNAISSQRRRGPDHSIAYNLAGFRSSTVHTPGPSCAVLSWQKRERKRRGCSLVWCV